MRVSNRFSIAAVAGFFAVSLGACGDREAAEGEAAAEPRNEVMVAETDPFLTLDANGDSYLDADEIAEWVDDEGILMSWDIDADSEIDEDDIEGNAFRIWVQDDLNRTTFKHAYFELYDTNDDGLVDRMEWDSGLAFHGIPTLS